MKKDTLFANYLQKVNRFEFNDQVVEVFDDMITRCVPHYVEMIKRQAQLISIFYQEDTSIYDLGCSTGNLAVSTAKVFDAKPFHWIGIDTSQPMLDKFQERIDTEHKQHQFDLRCESVQASEFIKPSVVVINYTLQFIPSDDRLDLLKRIYDSLPKNGILLLSEKIINPESNLAELQNDIYFQFKRENGYSNMEISQKRDALEDVLIPDTLEQHLHRLNTVGFKNVEIWQKWFQFTSFICQK